MTKSELKALPEDGMRRRQLCCMLVSTIGTSFLASCGSEISTAMAPTRGFSVSRDYSRERHPVLRVDRAKFDARLHPQIVESPFQYRPSTVIVDNRNSYLYLQKANGEALRYGVGVGRRGRAWSGVATIALKREWPAWNPTARMRNQEPTLPAYVSPGNHNPLGARALYLFQNGVDTLYRIHGTSEPWTIGTQASSGCIRMINEDVIDLYDRVNVNTSVIVI